MKNMFLFLILTGFTGLTAAQSARTETNAAAPTANVTNETLGAVSVASTNVAEPVISTENSTNGLRINFRGAPLNLVLDYLFTDRRPIT